MAKIIGYIPKKPAPEPVPEKDKAPEQEKAKEKK